MPVARAATVLLASEVFPVLARDKLVEVRVHIARVTAILWTPRKPQPATAPVAAVYDQSQQKIMMPLALNNRHNIAFEYIVKKKELSKFLES